MTLGAQLLIKSMLKGTMIVALVRLLSALKSEKLGHQAAPSRQRSELSFLVSYQSPTILFPPKNSAQGKSIVDVFVCVGLSRFPHLLPNAC